MPRRAATVTQADVARAIRAAKAEGWNSVRVIGPNGVVIEIGDRRPDEKPVEPRRIPVL